VFLAASALIVGINPKGAVARMRVLAGLRSLREWSLGRPGMRRERCWRLARISGPAPIAKIPTQIKARYRTTRSGFTSTTLAFLNFR
jgi:hypothetical protein